MTSIVNQKGINKLDLVVFYSCGTGQFWDDLKVGLVMGCGIVPDWHDQIRLVVRHKGMLLCDKRGGGTVDTLNVSSLMICYVVPIAF